MELGIPNAEPVRKEEKKEKKTLYKRRIARNIVYDKTNAVLG